MNNIREIEVPDVDGTTTTFVIIDRGNEEFTSMPKTLWEELEAQKELGGTL
jgi:hypothetical protein